ncbi:MAG: uL13 family ribosomal protein, partial [bacterium]
ARKPETLIERAVKGMMAKNALNRGMLRRLKVYAGSAHPHLAQQPKPLEI